MLVKDAKAIAREWITQEAAKLPGFYGAYFAGSTNWLPDDAPLPVGSDVDVMVVLDDPNPPIKIGKFVYRGVLLEVSYLPGDRLQSPEQVLGDYHLAGGLRTPSVVLDPTGRLTELQAAVAKDFAKRQWVVRRCEQARDKVLTNLRRLDGSAAFHDQVTSWLFPTGVTTHVLLTAGLKNPTVRLRYLAARELLAAYDRLEVYPALLALLGCAQMSRARVERHLAALTEVFDVAKTLVKTPFFFASDISDEARPIAIDGSRALIERGDPREAVFWIVATYARCLTALAHDAPGEVQDRFVSGFRELLGDLGIESVADLQRRSEQVIGFLPRLWEVTEAILAANPEIEE